MVVESAGRPRMNLVEKSERSLDTVKNQQCAQNLLSLASCRARNLLALEIDLRHRATIFVIFFDSRLPKQQNARLQYRYSLGNASPNPQGLFVPYPSHEQQQQSRSLIWVLLF